MIILSAKNIVKSFDGARNVLNDVCLDVEIGEFVSIVGASGSGKSTLLTILGGIDKPTSGSVFLDGKDITAFTEAELAVLRRTKIGYVFQFFNLAPYLTAFENIMLPIILSGTKAKSESEKFAVELMEYMGIAQYKNTLPGKLSGGEQQRVAIARGLIFRPQIILLDEPTGNLDSKTGKEIMELLVNINQKYSTSVIQVTHSKTNAAYASKIISIEDGKIVDRTHQS